MSCQSLNEILRSSTLRPFVRFVLLLVDSAHGVIGDDSGGLRFTLLQIVWENRRASFFCAMSLDTLLEAAKFLENSSKGTSKDDSAIARGTVD